MLCVSIFFLLSPHDASAATSKVYKEYDFPSDLKKFPMQLTNGLTIGKVYSDFSYVPTIKKGSETLWTGSTIDPDALINFSFTVTSNNDTYFYFHTGYRGTESVTVVGVSAAGKVFLEKDFAGNGRRMTSKFLTTNTIEIGAERVNPDPYASQADLGLGIYDAKVYQLYINGKIEIIPYVDKSFASLAKQGQLKGVPGVIGGTFKSLKATNDFNSGWVEQSETHISFTMSNAYYVFTYEGSYDSIKSTQTIRAIYKNSLILGTNKTIGPQLKSYFGAPIYKSTNQVYVYKSGKYYLAVKYEDNTAQFVIMNKWFYDLVKIFNL